MDFWYRYFYKPNVWQKALSVCLLPFSVCYCLIATLKRRLAKKQDFGIPIISVGNLIAGGSGKTPFLIHIANFISECQYGEICVISRGYKRKSTGLVWVSKNGDILCDVKKSGDEPYLIAKSCKDISVLVCKNREFAIKEAIKSGAQIILLDDGLRFRFAKLDFILRPKEKPYFDFCLPSGIYRENPALYHTFQANPLAKILQEERDFFRIVTITNQTPKMLLLTAIANPQRLKQFLPPHITHHITKEICLKDHSDFNKQHINSLLTSTKATSILTTQKDEVKLEHFGFKLSIMNLELYINVRIREYIKLYVLKFIKPATMQMLHHKGGAIFVSASPAHNVIDLFLSLYPQASKLEILEVLEYLILQNLKSFWLKSSELCFPYKNDLELAFSYDAEMIEMFGSLFLSGYIDICFCDTNLTKDSTQSQPSLPTLLSLPLQQQVWIYFRDHFFYHQIFMQKSRIMGDLDSRALESSVPKSKINSKIESKIESHAIDFDNPKTWNLDSIFMRLTSKGEEYFYKTLAPNFYQKYKSATLTFAP